MYTIKNAIMSSTTIYRFLIFSLLFLPLMGNSQTNYNKQWEKIDSLEKKGLYADALKNVKQLFILANENDNTSQIIKTTLHSLKYNQYITEDDFIKGIASLENQISNAKDGTKQLLHSVLAEVYYGYYSQNSWKFNDRTSLNSSIKNEDVRTWTLKKLAKRIIFHYQSSIQKDNITSAISIQSIKDIINNHYSKEFSNNSLFDFLSHRALNFYKNNSFNIPGIANGFSLNNPDYFSSNSTFKKLEIRTNDSLDLKFYAVNLFQKLSTFYQKNPTRLFQIDLNRIKHIKNHSTLSNRESLYKSRLEQITVDYKNYEFVSEAWFEIAQNYNETGTKYSIVNTDSKWDIAKAVEICNKVIKTAPSSFGAKQCQALLSQIHSKNIRLKTEVTYLPNQNNLLALELKNIDYLYLKIIPLNHKKIFKNGEFEKFLKIEKGIYTKTIKVDLPKDFQTHSIEELIPELETGYYTILVSSSPKFEFENNGYAHSNFWVTQIGFQTKTIKNGIELIAYCRKTGHPLEDAEIKVKERHYNRTLRKYVENTAGNLKTDKNGKAVFTKIGKNHNYYFSIKSGNDQYDPSFNKNYWTRYHSNFAVKSVNLYTDRSIYRPGQTIYFKAIATESANGDYTLLKKFKTTVTFLDVNHQKINSIELTTNEFGSFEGQFIAPQGVLTGSMSIKTAYGQKQVQVEEYKRPKFFVKLNDLIGDYQINDSISVEGIAESFAGSKITEAKVVYRVQRTTRYNFYRWWYPVSTSKEIANGESITNKDGSYSIKFKALADETLDPKNLPIFNYTVFIDVVDINGETHSTSKVYSIGYQNIFIVNNIPETVNSNEDLSITIKSTSLNGKHLSAKGTFSINKLKTPENTYITRYWTNPDLKTWNKNEFNTLFPYFEYNNENNIEEWQIEKELINQPFNTGGNEFNLTEDISKWTPGKYKFYASTIDKNGVKVEDEKYFTIIDNSSKKSNSNQVFSVTNLKHEYQPGDNAKLLLSTAEKHLNIYYSYDINGDNNEHWVHLKKGQEIVEIPIKESQRGGFNISFIVVKNNRVYNKSLRINVPYINKDLAISIESFRDKLLPGENETWTILIKNHKNEKANAELLASLYDASLDDLFKANTFNLPLPKTSINQYNWDRTIGFNGQTQNNLNYYWNSYVNAPYRTFPTLNYFGYYIQMHNYGQPMYFSDDAIMEVQAVAYQIKGRGKGRGNGGASDMMYKAIKNESEEAMDEAMEAPTVSEGKKDSQEETQVESNNSSFQPRKNFNETAFFYPQLHTNSEGEIRIKFTMPESLTKWKFIGLAHTQTLETGTITKEIVTQKDLMVIPNLPRFLRENDQITISTKIANLSDSIINGTVELILIDPFTNENLDINFNNKEAQKTFTVSPDGNAEASWNIDISDKYNTVSCIIKAVSENHTDGEETTLPILTNRMLVTESMPMSIRGNSEKVFEFKKLMTQKSTTLKHHSLSLEFTSNPVWYAIQAMPYMMEYPYECSEQVFTRYYSNALATHVLNEHPKINDVINQWKNESPNAFLSKLNKNQELKALFIEETPWVLQSKSETENKKNIAILLDLERMKRELETALNKIVKKQSRNGGWPWFSGMKENRYITQHILSGFGHLRQLGVIDLKKNRKVESMIKKGIKFIDDKIVNDLEFIKKYHSDYLTTNHLSYIQIQYLYIRSFFPEYAIKSETQEAVNYFSEQSSEYWTSFNIYAQGMIGMASNRMDIKTLSKDIHKSLKNNAIQNEEMGMYWKSHFSGYYWYQAPIETQAMMIEFFNEMKDSTSVDELKIWLLKEKQTTHWKTTKQTTEAVFALLLNGDEMVNSNSMVDIYVADKKIEYVTGYPSNPYQVKSEAGTGYIKTTWSNTNQITPEMGKVKVVKDDKGVAWGSLYWQYFEQLDKITKHETPLKLEKKLYKVELTKDGEILNEIHDENAINIGDKIRVRIELRTDRNLEYVHLKDMRAACFEPLNVISSYKYQDGLGYYQTTKDASTNFFFDYIPKGTYVFEYDLRSQHIGEFSNGISSIQCMYAPEFTSHSEGIRVKIN